MYLARLPVSLVSWNGKIFVSTSCIHIVVNLGYMLPILPGYIQLPSYVHFFFFLDLCEITFGYYLLLPSSLVQVFRPVFSLGVFVLDIELLAR